MHICAFLFSFFIFSCLFCFIRKQLHMHAALLNTSKRLSFGNHRTAFIITALCACPMWHFQTMTLWTNSSARCCQFLCCTTASFICFGSFPFWYTHCGYTSFLLLSSKIFNFSHLGSI